MLSWACFLSINEELARSSARKLYFMNDPLTVVMKLQLNISQNLEDRITDLVLNGLPSFKCMEVFLISL